MADKPGNALPKAASVSLPVPQRPIVASSARAFLTALFDRAVAVADPMQVVPRQIPPRPKGRFLVIGAGKASARMAEAVEKTIGPCEGLVITRYGYGRPTQGVEIVEAGHPVPDAAGARATLRMLELVAGLGPDDLVLALISGGGSALLCAPAEGLTLADKMAVNAALLASGAPIGEMNVVRKHLSRVKAGRLAVACHPARLLTLLISDVPGDNPAEIASGPTVGEVSTPDDARAILVRHGITASAAVLAVLQRPSTVIAPDDPRLAMAQTRIIAAPAQSLAAAAEYAESAGVITHPLGDALEGEARELGAAHARLALSLRGEVAATGKPLVLLSGGECTVTRRGNGIGGPNAEYVLAAAIALDGAPDIHVLACDTDGVDGAAEVAGAVAGPECLILARAKGIDPAKALARNDAHRFFGAIGGQVVTGPTLTNVNDFRAILILPES
ncbi:glycerate kinase [Pseudorhodobacter sp.]|uniref:glycerate kinase type-2 family protein n=1 Tax=Pseudorhodobacter sp. TaxID=1934400 RepID=UPI00264753A0|nr:glycerate kinase [Pseudorhodobacter sp.]MDN5787595.1 glycerate kinase [Pseudorhodobacter sp.]